VVKNTNSLDSLHGMNSSNVSFSSTPLNQDGSERSESLPKLDERESRNSRLLGNLELSPCVNSADGLYPHPQSCEHFIQCVHGQEHVQSCAPGTVFNPNTFVCDWETNVPNCINRKKPDSTMTIMTRENLNDNRVRRSVLDHYNVISIPELHNSGEGLLRKHDVSSRVKRASSSIAVAQSKISRKCSWSDNYIQPHPQYCNKFEICSNGRVVEQTCGNIYVLIQIDMDLLEID
jgi:hypothetical protein